MTSPCMLFINILCKQTKNEIEFEFHRKNWFKPEIHFGKVKKKEVRMSVRQAHPEPVSRKAGTTE